MGLVEIVERSLAVQGGLSTAATLLVANVGVALLGWRSVRIRELVNGVPVVVQHRVMVPKALRRGARRPHQRRKR